MLKVITNLRPIRRLSIIKRHSSKESQTTLETHPSEGSASQCWLQLNPSFELPDEDETSVASEPTMDPAVVPLSSSCDPTTPSHVVRAVHRHRRSGAFDNGDFDELLTKSRGWMYDPSAPPSPFKKHHDRSRNLSLVESDFDRFIFKSAFPKME
jgi:hypothetical protein